MASLCKPSQPPKFSILIVVLFAIVAGACSSESFPPEKTPTLTDNQNKPAIETPAGITQSPEATEEFIQITPDQEQACPEDGGRIEHYQFDSKIIGKSQQVNVYTPPCYDPQLDEGYPALILLHGQGQNENFWVDAGLAETSDNLIKTHKTVPYVVIIPFEEYYLEDILKSRFGDMLIKELIPWADSTFALRDGQRFRAIGGNSRGAYWAFRLAFKYWGNFGSVGVHSMPFFGEPNALRLWLEQIPQGELPRVSMDSGDGDRYLKDALGFEHLLGRYQIPHEWHLREGEHDAAYWQSNLEAYLLWYAQTWNE